MDFKINGGKPEPFALFRRDGSARTAGAVSQSSGGYLIADTGTTAQVGDVYRPETATTSAMVYKEYKIIAVPDANSFVIASKDLPTAGDTFYILGPVTPIYSSSGIPSVTIDTTGLATSAKQDTIISEIGATNETAPATDTATSGLNGRLQRIAQRLTSLIALFPSSLGSKAEANSLAVTASTEDVGRIGIVTETAPATDTASSGLNGRLQRIAQRLTSLIALLPASLGQKADADSLAVTISTEGTAQLGSLTETAPATDTASSGLNGRLQRIAQRITSLIALLPTSLGQGTMATSFQVVLPSDQSAIPTNATLQTGTNVIGKVSIDQTTPGTTNLVALANNQSVNVNQIGGTSVSTGNGVSGTGVQRVTIASDSTYAPKTGAKTAVGKARNDYSSVNVTTSAYTELVASTSAAVSEVEIFDSSGQTLVLATGAAASEADQVYIFPGGNGRIPLSIAASTRISIKAVSATASVGEISLNLYST